MSSTPSTLDYFVENMDCASCVQKVERMVATLPGTAEVKTSFARQTLRLRLDETQTSRERLEGNLRSLGYAPSLLTGPAGGDEAHSQQAEHGHSHAPETGRPWYAGAQGRLVLLSGALLALAFAFGFAVPRLAVDGYVAATLIGVWPLLRKALASVRLGDPFSINMLVGLAAIGALLIGQAAEGAVVVFLFALGELLEGVAAGRARAGIRALAALAPRTALLLSGSGLREVPADSLRVGQTVQVNPGARLPADGHILNGTSGLDDSPVTGESIPVFKEPGDSVYAGSINGDGVLTVRVEKTSADNTIARILHLVEEAEGSRAPTARFIERFSRAYTPGVVLVAALVALGPPLLLGQAWHPWLYKAISLLLIGCPCALVLSVPAAVTSALAAAARRGLLVKGGAALERVGDVGTVAFDKTGTLTAGKPRVTDLIGLELDGAEVLRLEVLRLAAAVESGSSHPLARALLDEARRRGLSLPAAAEAGAVPGKAVSARVEGRALTVASPRHAAELTPLPAVVRAQIETLEGQGRTTVILLEDARPLGLLALRDEPRPGARAALAELRRLGLSVVMLSGDNARTAQAIAAELGLADFQVQAELLPADKLRIIAELRAAGGVAMVGDGINDAPALAAADVGVAMGGGSDVALETADAALLGGQLAGMADLVGLSRATLFNIRQNIAFALGLKAIFLVTTLLGYTGLWLAVLADTGATALVTANALRLLGWRPHPRPVSDQTAAPERQELLV
ncbi:heavy metal translocating P-type ATPase [Deinococcus sp.]|uniref:heavy metal translocating P-type ATPase n=1 Tax=Deinococcus sp. TaxID=47478 RepID=UPI003CC6A3B1